MQASLRVMIVGMVLFVIGLGYYQFVNGTAPRIQGTDIIANESDQTAMNFSAIIAFVGVIMALVGAVIWLIRGGKSKEREPPQKPPSSPE